MKKNVLVALVVAGEPPSQLATKKVDEKTMAEMNQFTTDWSAMGEKASNWSKSMMETATHAKEVATKQTEMMNSMMNSKDEAMKTKMHEMAETATQNAANFDAMMNDWNTFKTTWDENTKAYTEWTAKVTTGEVPAADVEKGMADWKTKMTDAQQKMDNWNTAYNAAKESTDKNMAAYDEMSKTMSTTPVVNHTNTPAVKVKK